MSYLGKTVEVKVVSPNRHGLTGKLIGEILPEVDWLVGCPVFKERNSGALLGVGYECEILREVSL